MKPKSRSVRFNDALVLVSDARSQIEELKEELENWRDNLPENLQSSSKAEDLENAIGELENCIQCLDDAENTSVDFPGMF